VILDVHRKSTEVEIRDAYYRLARRWHPDRKRGDTDMFVIISQADDAIRAEMDRYKRAERMKLKCDPCSWCSGSGVVWVGKGFTNKKPSRCEPCGGEGYVPRAAR
jgi:DnaJ-class molecular chaperone